MASFEKLFRGSCDFAFGAAKEEDLPHSTLPEVAFAGRSNVGKSSLINAVVKRNGLARTSKNPGCTRQVNFFNLGGEIMICDLPGYGYARASRKEVDGWTQLVNLYLTGRPNLQRVFLLIDSRHGMKDNDREIMKMLDISAVSYQIVLTKADKQSKEEIEKILANIEQLALKHTALHPEVLITSSAKGIGIDEVRSEIANFCGC